MSEEHGIPEWAKEHQASFQTEPLIEMKGSEKVTVGFTLNLYATLPMDKAPGAARREAAAVIWARLRSILDSALGEEARKPRVEVEPMRTAAVLRPENEMQPEITLRARVQHEAFEAVTPAERDSVAGFEKKLVARGLRAGHW